LPGSGINRERRIETIETTRAPRNAAQKPDT
jgi:hypothetical protein